MKTTKTTIQCSSQKLDLLSPQLTKGLLDGQWEQPLETQVTNPPSSEVPFFLSLKAVVK